MILRKLKAVSVCSLSLVAACSGGDSGSGGAAAAAGSGATGGSGGSGGSGAVGGNADEQPFEDPAADAPALDLPPAITDASNSIVNAASLTEAIAATQAVLAKGGVATVSAGTVLTPGQAPASTAYVEALVIGDIALEAWKRGNVATLTATQLGEMFADLGMPVPDGKTAGQVMVEALAAWTNAALAAPDDPASFGILFIAATNQLQSPRANISLVTQDPDLVRFSLLDLELLSAAIERVSTKDPSPIAADPGPCTVMNMGWGDWAGTVKTGTSAGSQLIVGEFVKKIGGEASEQAVGAALNVLSIATKIVKVAQTIRYGTLLVTIDTENPTKKPRPSGAQKFGSTTATAGVDQQAYQELQDWISQQGQTTLNELNACLDYLGLPTKTDVGDVAKDVANWRVSWDITKGSGSEVLFKQGQKFKIGSRLENPLTSSGPTEAKNKVEFEILPQLADVDQGKERVRHAVFSAQLRRGQAPGLDTLWGAGSGGYAVAGAVNFASLLGVAGSLVDIAGNWALEVASPKRFATQTLIEIEPKGWVGTILVTEQGSGSERLDTGNMPIDGVWSAWTGKLKYESRINLGGTVPVSGDISEMTGVGQAAADCEAYLDDSAASSNCYEGCPTAIEPGPLTTYRQTLTAFWGQKEELGNQSSIIVAAYPEEAFAPIKDQLPPEIQAKIGTWEMYITPLGCGEHKAVSRTQSVDVQLISPNYITTPSETYEEIPVVQAWAGPYPPGDAPLLMLTGKLDGSDPNRIQADLTMPRSAPIPSTSYAVKTVFRVQVNIRRVD